MDGLSCDDAAHRTGQGFAEHTDGRGGGVRGDPTGSGLTNHVRNRWNRRSGHCAIRQTLPRLSVLYVSYDGAMDPLGQSQVLPYGRGLWPHERLLIPQESVFLPTACQDGAASENFTSSSPALFMMSEIASLVNRCSNGVPNQSRASLRITEIASLRASLRITHKDLSA